MLTDAGAVTVAVQRAHPVAVRAGISVRDIRSHLADLYGVEISPDLISAVTDAVIDELTAWQNRPLDAVWPIIYIDALWVKIRSGPVVSRPVYVVVGVDMEGRKDVLGQCAS